MGAFELVVTTEALTMVEICDAIRTFLGGAAKQ